MPDVKKTQRKDKLKNKAKVVKEVLKDPLATDRDIEKKTGVWKSTANRVRQELGQAGTKDDRIVGICNQDIEIVELANKVRRRYVEQIINKKEELKPSEISEVDKISNTSQKRYSIFMGDRTDDKGWLKTWLDNLYDEKQ